MAFVDLYKAFGNKNSICNEVQNRIHQASAALWRLRCRIFRNKNLYLHTVVCIYQVDCLTTSSAVLKPVTYNRHIKAMEHFHIQCTAFSVFWDHLARPSTSYSAEQAVYCKYWGNYHPTPTAMAEYPIISCLSRCCMARKTLTSAMLEGLKRLGADCNTWQQLCSDGTQALEDVRTARRQQWRLRRNTPMGASAAITTFTCATAMGRVQSSKKRQKLLSCWRPEVHGIIGLHGQLEACTLYSSFCKRNCEFKIVNYDNHKFSITQALIRQSVGCAGFV